MREYVIQSGKIIPVEGDPTITAIHVRDGRIHRTGHDELVDQANQQGIDVIDRRNSVVLPGFVDCHVHFDLFARKDAKKPADCRYPTCKSIDDVLGALRDAESYEGWIIGSGNLFLDQKLADRRLPTKHDLDRVSTTTPIILHCGGHLSVLNSAAIELIPPHVFDAGLSGLWGAPRVERENGELTGRFAEIDGHLPIPEPGREDHVKALVASAKRYLRHGVTTLADMTESRESLDLLKELTQSREIDLRLRSILIARAVGSEDEVIAMAAEDTELARGPARFAISGVKMFSDGGYSSRNAATLTEYLPSEAVRPYDRGRINLSYAEIRRFLAHAREQDVQLAIHANGARAQKEVMQAVIDSGDPYAHRAVRVEHLGNLVPELSMLDMIKRSGVVPVMQPGFLYDFVGDFIPVVLGDPARQGRMPVRTLLDDGIVPVFSSDNSHVNPLFNCGVAESRRGFWGAEIEPWESISLAEAIPLHTLEAARALSMDETVGSLLPGKEADFILYAEDPTTYSGDLAELTPHEVHVHGEPVHGGG